MGIKWVFIDLDHTLLNTFNKINLAKLKVLKRYLIQGGNIVLTTGKWPVVVNICNKKIENFCVFKNKYYIAMGGAYIYDLNQHKIIFQKFIPQNLFADFLVLQKKNNLRVWIYSVKGISQKTVYTIRQPAKLILRRFVFGKLKEYDHINQENDPKYKLLIISTKNNIYKNYEILNKQLGHSLKVIKTNDNLIEITAKNVDKGQALLFLQQKEKIKTSEIAVIGDSNNDISMFEKANVRINVRFDNIHLHNLTDYNYYSHKSFAYAFNKHILQYNAPKKHFFNKIYLKCDFEIELKNSYTLFSYIYLWHYLILQNEIYLESKYSFLINKKIFQPFLINQNSFLISDNQNSFFDYKKQKFLYAKSFSDTQKQTLLGVLKQTANKVIMLQNKQGDSLLVYDDQKLLEQFWHEQVFDPDEFNHIIAWQDDLSFWNDHIVCIISYQTKIPLLNENFEVVKIGPFWQIQNQTDSSDLKISAQTKRFCINKWSELASVDQFLAHS